MARIMSPTYHTVDAEGDTLASGLTLQAAADAVMSAAGLAWMVSAADEARPHDYFLATRPLADVAAKWERNPQPIYADTLDAARDCHAHQIIWRTMPDRAHVWVIADGYRIADIADDAGGSWMRQFPAIYDTYAAAVQAAKDLIDAEPLRAGDYGEDADEDIDLEIDIDIEGPDGEIERETYATVATVDAA